MTEIDSNPEARSTRRRTITITTLTLGVLAAGGVAAAVAANSANASGPAASGGSGSSGSSSSSSSGSSSTTCTPGNDFDGLITAADSSSVTVHDLLGTSRTYTIGSSTTIHDGPSSKVSASSLTTGEHVHVRGTKSGSTYTASDIDVHPAAIDGSITSLGATSITVTDRDGFTRSIVTDGSTTYSSAGKSVSRTTLKSGSAVHAEGTVDANGTSLDAGSVTTLTAGSGPAGAPAKGVAPKAGSVPKSGSKPAAPAGGADMCGPAGGPGRGGRGPMGAPGAANGSRPSAPSGSATTGSKPSGAPSGAPSKPSTSAS